jgi:hypothetical protein
MGYAWGREPPADRPEWAQACFYLLGAAVPTSTQASEFVSAVCYAKLLPSPPPPPAPRPPPRADQCSSDLTRLRGVAVQLWRRVDPTSRNLTFAFSSGSYRYELPMVRWDETDAVFTVETVAELGTEVRVTLAPGTGGETIVSAGMKFEHTASIQS